MVRFRDGASYLLFSENHIVGIQTKQQRGNKLYNCGICAPYSTHGGGGVMDIFKWFPEI